MAVFANLLHRFSFSFLSSLNDQLAAQHAHLTLKAVLACFIGREFRRCLFTFGQQRVLIEVGKQYFLRAGRTLVARKSQPNGARPALTMITSQIVWADQIRTDESGRVWYRLIEKYGSGDIFWGQAEAFHPLTAEEISPINPQAEDKRIVVKIWERTLSCFEGKTEVHFARISSGALYDAWGNRVDAWATPVGESPIWRKAVSLPLSGGSASAGWSLPAVGWVSLFMGTGVAIHSTYWHNNYGEPSSRGCVNASPEDAQWVFRWSQPKIPYDPGDVTKVRLPRMNG